jgi:hypothetical protein
MWHVVIPPVSLHHLQGQFCSKKKEEGLNCKVEKTNKDLKKEKKAEHRRFCQPPRLPPLLAITVAGPTQGQGGAPLARQGRGGRRRRNLGAKQGRGGRRRRDSGARQGRGGAPPARGSRRGGVLLARGKGAERLHEAARGAGATERGRGEEGAAGAMQGRGGRHRRETARGARSRARQGRGGAPLARGSRRGGVPPARHEAACGRVAPRLWI